MLRSNFLLKYRPRRVRVELILLVAKQRGATNLVSFYSRRSVGIVVLTLVNDHHGLSPLTIHRRQSGADGPLLPLVGHYPWLIVVSVARWRDEAQASLAHAHQKAIVSFLNANVRRGLASVTRILIHAFRRYQTVKIFGSRSPKSNLRLVRRHPVTLVLKRLLDSCIR